ncbi:hypothetical protein ACFFRR_010981 [Megaselia abdita]
MKHNKKESKSTKQQVLPIIDVDLDDDTELEINWLKKNANTSNWTIYISKWNKFFSLRINDYQTKEFSNVVERWKILTNVDFADELILTDFQFFYATKVNLFGKRYTSFLEFFARKHQNNILIPEVDGDSREFALFQIIHYILTPTAFAENATTDRPAGVSKPRWKAAEVEKLRKTINTEAEKIERIRNKFTREASVKSTVIILEAEQNFEDEVAAYAEEKSKAKLHFHPIMGVFKNNAGIPVNFVLYLNGIILKQNSFKDLLLLYLGVFHLFDMCYPTEGRLVCELLSHCLLDFPISGSACRTAENLAENVMIFINQCLGDDPLA